MRVTFHNVTITIEGKGVTSPENAYDRLCAALASVERPDNRVLGEWTTAVWTTDGDSGVTSKLFPKEGSKRQKTGGDLK